MTKSVAHIVLMMISAAAASAAVQVTAQVDASRPIYADSAFNYSIIVAGGPQPEDVDLSLLKEYNPAGPSTQQQTSIVNGRTSSYNILTYQLIAPATGPHTIPSVTVTVDGKPYQTNPVTFTVVQAGSTKQIDARMELSDTSCYVGQPVVLTFSFFVWTDTVRNKMIANPDFRVPILDSDAFYIEEVDSAALQQRPDEFAVNGRPQPVLQDQVNHDGVDCVRVQFSKVLIPKQAGDFTLEAAAASADLATGQAAPSRRGMFDNFFGPQYQFERFTARTKPLALKVLPLPDSGKPADFYGLVGNYTISASATPVKVNVGDPVTLTICIGGSPYLKPVQWPALESLNGFADFKIPAERADGEIQSGQKVFTQTIRAGSESVKQIPPIPLSFFDAASGKYKTVYSEAILLDVAPTRMVTGADIESNASFTPARRQMQSIKEGLSANYTTADALTNQQFHLGAVVAGPAFWALWAGPAAMLLVSLVGRAVTNQDPRRMAARRRKAAYSVALRSIRRISPHSASAGPELARALKQYIADKFTRVPGALTAEDCRCLLAEYTAGAELADRFKQITERAEAAAYSPAAFEFDAAAKNQLIALLREVDKEIK